MSAENSKLVYSTDQLDLRKEKRTALQAKPQPAQQKVTVRLDRKSRGGKSVTVIEGLQMTPKERETLLKQLKTKLGTGGTVKEAVLEIQGDHRSMVIQVMEQMGYRPKRAGG
jgi:translation initiation factor 1